MQLTILSNRCAEILKTRINERNVFSIRRFALLYNVPQAVVDADCYIQRHFSTVSKSEEFAQLDFSSVMQILGWDQLHVDSEERVFEAVIHWLEFDIPGRQVFAPKYYLFKNSFLSFIFTIFQAFDRRPNAPFAAVLSDRRSVPEPADLELTGMPRPH